MSSNPYALIVILDADRLGLDVFADEIDRGMAGPDRIIGMMNATLHDIAHQPIDMRPHVNDDRRNFVGACDQYLTAMLAS